MKTLALVATLLVAATLGLAADKKPLAGPKGGKLLENSAPRAEFFIEKDNRVTITFYDEQLKPVPAGEQVVLLTAEPKTGKVKLTLEKKDGVLVSSQPLPNGGKADEYQITLQIKAKADAKPQNFRLRFDLDICEKCKRKEYACICDQ